MPCNFLAQPVTVEHKAALLQNECAHSKAIYIYDGFVNYCDLFFRGMMLGFGFFY